MANYQQQIAVQANADAVFDYISDPRNMPHYLPTVHKAEMEGGERVRMQGEAHGHPYNSDGYLRMDRDAMRLSWGSDESDYSGWMDVEEVGGDTHVTVELSFSEEKSDGRRGPSPEQIREGLLRALESIKDLMEGRTPKKRQPSVAGNLEKEPQLESELKH